jgi:hypothetical protein
MNIMKVKKDNDPFKKYWWVILLGFAGVGAWVCMPLMDTPVGSASVKPHGLSTENQSLDSAATPTAQRAWHWTCRTAPTARRKTTTIP